MDKYLKYIIVAIIQGLTEILPISSSAHIIIIENFFNINTNTIKISLNYLMKEQNIFFQEEKNISLLSIILCI